MLSRVNRQKLKAPAVHFHLREDDSNLETLAASNSMFIVAPMVEL
jgi:hypothetical protein